MIRVVAGQAEDFVDAASELVMANVHYDLMRRLLERKGFQEKRWFILSGLMRSQAQKVKARLEHYNLRVIHEWDHQMIWYTMLVQNKKNSQ